jgi:hypothetical protein
VKPADHRRWGALAINESHFKKAESLKLAKRSQEIGFGPIDVAHKFGHRLGAGIANNAQQAVKERDNRQKLGFEVELPSVVFYVFAERTVFP